MAAGRDKSPRARRAALDAERSAQPRATAREEALARANPTRLLHSLTVWVVALGLVVTASMVVAASMAHDKNEDRLLEQRGHEAATVAGSSISGLQGQLAAASVAAESSAADQALFRQLVSPEVGVDRRFASASVWPVGSLDPQPEVVVGAAPLLAGQDVAARRRFLDAAATGATLHLRDFLDFGDRRLGYAYALPGAKFVVYAEAALPKDRRARIASDSAFADLDYALYLGDRPDPDHLLASSSGEPLRDGRTATDTVPFGDSTLLLVVHPRGELGGALLAALPWVLGAVGLLITFTAAFFAERLVRRREQAEELSDRLEEVAEKNAALYEWQRQVAGQLQRSLMPRSLPRLDRLESAGRYQAGVAGTEVGGDWYDVVPLSNRRLAFSVGDVCGRGLGAAALMASLRYSIRAYALEESDPGTILSKLSAVMETSPANEFATVICATLDADSGVLAVARAGHPDILAVERRGARYLDAPLGPPVGVDPRWEYQSVTIPLDDDVVLLAFTDGLVERRGEDLDVGLERLRVAAEAELPVAQLVTHLVDSLADTNDDDIAVLGLHWTRVAIADRPDADRGRSDGMIASLDLPADADAPGAARQLLRDALHTADLGGPGEIVELLTVELVTNVVQHVGSPMQLRLFRRPTSIRVELDDASPSVPVRQDPDFTAERGRGVLIVESLARAWGIEPRDGGKTVWFEVDLDGTDEERAVTAGSGREGG